MVAAGASWRALPAKRRQLRVELDDALLLLGHDRLELGDLRVLVVLRLRQPRIVEVDTHGYFSLGILTRRSFGFLRLAAGDALRVDLARMAPAACSLTPSLAAMFFCTLLKLISNPSNSVGKTALCDSRVRAPRTRTTIATAARSNAGRQAS